MGSLFHGRKSVLRSRDFHFSAKNRDLQWHSQARAAHPRFKQAQLRPIFHEEANGLISEAPRARYSDI